jgi:hypothetical protein
MAREMNCQPADRAAHEDMVFLRMQEWSSESFLDWRGVGAVTVLLLAMLLATELGEVAHKWDAIGGMMILWFSLCQILALLPIIYWRKRWKLDIAAKRLPPDADVYDWAGASRRFFRHVSIRVLPCAMASALAVVTIDVGFVGPMLFAYPGAAFVVTLVILHDYTLHQEKHTTDGTGQQEKA